MPKKKIRTIDERQDEELFEHTYADYAEIAQTFWQKSDALMEQRHWYASTFKEKTHLSDREYSRYMTERNTTPTLYTVLAICVGLDIDIQISDDLLASAGYKLNASKEHQAYHFALIHFRGRIDECNIFLADEHVKLLGSRNYR